MESRREICTLESCHLGPPAPGFRRSAATSPCPQDGAWVLPGSSKQYSQVNICHRQISSLIKPSQVSSASVPGQPEKLTQATELLRKKVKWQRPWGGGGCHGTSLGCGLGGRRVAVSSSPSKPLSCQRLCTSMLVCAQPGGVSSWAGSGRGLPTTALWRSFMAPCRPGPPTWCSCGAVACASKILLLAFVLGEEGVQPPASRSSKFTCRGMATGAPALRWGPPGQLPAHGAGGWLAATTGGGNQQLSPSPNNHNLPRARFT